MSKPPLPPGYIDFEITDFAEAKRLLEEPPAGLEAARRAQPGYWEQHRRALAATDRALTSHTLTWMTQLPANRRPEHLAQRHPRVANLLADAWTDKARCEALFTGLLSDDRGGRKGFAAEIAHELRRLAEYRSGLGA